MIEALESRTFLSSVAPLAPRLMMPIAHARDVTPVTSPPAATTAAIAIDTPSLPTVYLDTTYAPGTGTTISVPAGGNLQNAINAAQSGDTIELAAGATFTGNFTLPNKVGGDAWITIRTSTPDAQLPAPGTRITPAQAGLMAKIAAPNGAAALATQNGAHNYRIIGIEFTTSAGVGTTNGIITLGSGTQTAAQTPRDIILDRVYVHGGSATQQVQNGLRLNSARTAVIDSYFDTIQSTAFEGHCIGGFNGPGPFKIVNNTFNGGTIPVIFGGAVPSVPNLIPSDMEIRGNHFTRPLSWRPGDPSYGGTEWYVKNLFELKNGQRVLFEGNLLEHNWPHVGSTPDGSPQAGYAILLTVRDESNQAEWTTVSDITVVNNVVRKSNVGISLYGAEGIGTHRVKIENNLFDDIGLNWGNNDRSGLFAQVQTVGDLIINHNTIINDGDIIFANGLETGDLVFNNNIVNHNAARTINPNRGINGNGTAPGLVTLNAKFVEYDVTNNVMANATNPNLPAGNFFPANFAAVGFTNLATRDYGLAPSSAYNDAGTDGLDIGADFGTLGVATGGAVGGTWAQALQNITINQGAAQRSMVTEVTLTFNQPINSTAGALSLNRRGGSGVNFVATPSADLHAYTLTFSGPGITAGSLADGVYDFLADVSRFRDAFGTVPVGTRTNDDQTRTFHRLFGDSDGNRTVNNFDYAQFRNAFGSTSTQPAYRWYFDFDANTAVNNFDYAQFRNRFGVVLIY